MAVLKLCVCVCVFFSFFVVFYAKGREASDNLYTVYTAHPPYNPSLPPAPTPVCIVPEQQNVKAPTPLPKNKKKKNKIKKNPAPLQEAVVTRRGNQTLRNKINKRKHFFLLLCTISVIHL